MKKLFLMVLMGACMMLYAKETIVSPKDPKNPDYPVTDKENKTGSNDSNANVKINIEYKKQNSKSSKGIVSGLKGVYLKLKWGDNDLGTQELLLDFVKTIRVKGYTLVNKTKDNLTVVYYFPYVYDIILNDGSVIKNAEGRIGELESFLVYNSLGKEKCYSYFIRYWLDDKKMFTDNKSVNFNESPAVPGNVVITFNFTK